MILTRFYDQALAQASFLIGCSQSGEAVVIDPNRRVDQYLVEAERSELRIVAVTETHVHADFVSGARALAARAGARLLLSSEGGPETAYNYATEAGAVPLTHGTIIPVGQVRLETLHTPGHTPEHLSFLVADTAAATGPMGVVTGDFVFAGDVGRPDLLERVVGVANNADGAARTLFRSLQRFRELPDHLQVWPGHGAGSACGKGLSAMPQSTVGYEKLYNWAFAIHHEDEFVRAVLAGQPDPPKYFAEMKRMNRDGPPLGSWPMPQRLAPERLRPLLAGGATVVDLRSAASFAEGHIPGTISIPWNRSFTGWAGWLLSYDRDFYLLADQTGDAGIRRVVEDLAMIGLERIGGWFDAEVLSRWAGKDGDLERSPQVTLEQLAVAPDLVIVDLRNPSEWEQGRLPNARLIPLGTLPDRLEEIPRDCQVVLHCQGGGRSGIGLSILQAAGFRNAVNFTGGYSGWCAAGLPVVRG